MGRELDGREVVGRVVPGRVVPVAGRVVPVLGRVEAGRDAGRDEVGRVLAPFF